MDIFVRMGITFLYRKGQSNLEHTGRVVMCRPQPWKLYVIFAYSKLEIIF